LVDDPFGNAYNCAGCLAGPRLASPKQVIVIAPESIGKRISTRLFHSPNPAMPEPPVAQKVAGRASAVEALLLSLTHNCILPEAIIANGSVT
jgi:hypothetical protein